MSLINDALKRASETRKQTGDPPPPVALNPVDYAVRPNPGFRLLVVLMLLTALAFAIWFLSKWQEHSAVSAKLEALTNRSPLVVAIPVASTSPQINTKPRIRVSTNVVIRPRPDVNPPSEPNGVVPTVIGPTPDVENAVADKPVASTNKLPTEAAAAAPAEATNAFPKLKLQSIVYRLSKPAVVINGEMLHAGDTVRDVRIVRIERFAVTVEWHGQTNVLSLPRL